MRCRTGSTPRTPRCTPTGKGSKGHWDVVNQNMQPFENTAQKHAQAYPSTMKTPVHLITALRSSLLFPPTRTSPRRFDSEIFQDDWFGAASPTSSDHAIQRGLWAGVKLPDGSAYKVGVEVGRGGGVAFSFLFLAFLLFFVSLFCFFPYRLCLSSYALRICPHQPFFSILHPSCSHTYIPHTPLNP